MACAQLDEGEVELSLRDTRCYDTGCERPEFQQLITVFGEFINKECKISIRARDRCASRDIISYIEHYQQPRPNSLTCSLSVKVNFLFSEQFILVQFQHMRLLKII